MIFDFPTLFEDAVREPKVKALLPTTLTHDELRPIRGELRNMAVVSARVHEASILQKVHDIVGTVVQPDEVDGVTKGFNMATARVELKEALKRVGYQPPEGERGRITDLSSDARLDLIVSTSADITRGHGQWLQGQDDDVLEMFPAQELYRGEDRMEPRDWNTIWSTAAAEVDERALRVFQETGRMIALKDSPIWLHISDFGLPFPPFKFNSGMTTDDVDFEEAEALGLMEPGRKVEKLPINLGAQMKMSVSDIPEPMQRQILEALGPGYTIKEGVLTRD